MMIFGVCFVLYLIKLSAGKGVWNSVNSAHFKSAIRCAILFLLVWSVVKFNWFAQSMRIDRTVMQTSRFSTASQLF